MINNYLILSALFYKIKVKLAISKVIGQFGKKLDEKLNSALIIENKKLILYVAARLIFNI